MNPTPFIAEVSSNHGQDMVRALAFIEAAARIGCAGVKFQQFRIEELFSPEALAYDTSLFKRRGWELPVEFNWPMAEAAHELGLQYASTPFYWDAIGELEPCVDFFKVSSYQVLWLDFLREVASTGKPVVLATGMADIDEVSAAVEALAQGGCEAPTLLHCVSLYPTRSEDAGLASINTLRDRFGVPVGWSDHSRSADVVLRAVRKFDAQMIEFHMDLDQAGEEYHFGHCWLPDAIATVIADSKKELASEESADGPSCMQGDSCMDGDGVKQPRPGEAHERIWRSDPDDGMRPIRSARPGLLDLELSTQQP